MDKLEHSMLRKIKGVEEFRNIMKKMTIDKELNEYEKSYILTCAIVFLKHYKLDTRYSSYLELAYYIVLKYSIKYEDYTPLYDISINIGFYPITKKLIEERIVNNIGINDIVIENKLDQFKNDEYIETYEQNKMRKSILNDESQEISYIAPTSFGKSSIIVEHIRKNALINDKVTIIVPTKSLLMQTYNLIKESNLDRKIIIHDEMYNGDKKFISILTQERAIRLLDKNDIYFDIIYLDEAHNIFGKDKRSILLSRLIHKNLIKNSNQKIVYLSPFIEDSNNLKIKKERGIREKRIIKTIKEPEYYEYRLNGEVYKYNRFLNEFYKLRKERSYFEYIHKTKGEKNFIYIRSPKKVEMYAEELYNNLTDIEDSQNINELIDELKRTIHEEFYMIRYLRKGIIYIHGKIPDLIKEYLESKYKDTKEIKFIIANTVILEGVNLPIDTLYIFNTYSLKGKELTNLIGRVNRLNSIFKKDSNNLFKLLPQIHFVNSEKYNNKNSNMSNKIKELRSKIFTDKIENPTLNSFDFDRLKINKRDYEIKFKQFEEIRANEAFILKNYINKASMLKKYLLNSDIDIIYEIDDKFVSMLLNRINSIDTTSSIWKNKNIVEKIYSIFINDKYTINDYEILRLKNEQARNYYKKHINNSQKYTLKENIDSMVRYFYARIHRKEPLFYIGNSYGETEKKTKNYNKLNLKVYVDLSKKTHEEIVNLAIIKLKLEDDFIKYKLSKFVVMMYDYNLIEEDEYNLFMYGTNNSKKIEFIKMGIGPNLISRLDSDNQLKNIYLDKNNNIKSNSEFKTYKDNVNDFYKFEINRFL